MRRHACVIVVGCGLSLMVAVNTAAQSALAGETIRISRAAGAITVDGDLSDEGWRDATRVVTWFEVSPGDNTEPAVKSVGYLAYDNRFLYVGFDFEDPNPSAIRSPLGDHDNVSGDSHDMAGIFIDALNSGRTANEFFINARNVQYDAVTDDASGENGAPDYFWDSATKITPRGWTAEMRIPFSSLRYQNTDPQTWGVILFRNFRAVVPQRARDRSREPRWGRAQPARGP